MKRKHKKKPFEERKIAMERIETLFGNAKEMFNKDRDLANRYVAIARKIAMKCKVKIPSKLKRQFCKHCYKYIMPGVNARVRLTNKMVVYYCKECKRFMKFRYK